MDQPNFLFIMADQLTPFMMGAYGNDVAITPNLDRLAEQGVVFDAHYTTCPLCSPARASLAAGRYCSNIGAYDNATEFPASVPTFMHHLRKGGYDVVGAGKMHFIGPDQLHGFEERITTDIYPAAMSWIPDWRRGAYLNPGTSVRVRVAGAGVCGWNEQIKYDDEVQFRCLERIREWGRVEERRPFMLMTSYTHPHDPYLVTQEYWDRYEGVDIPMPDVPDCRPEAWSDSYRALVTHHGVDEYDLSEEELRNARRAYLGMVTYIDDKVGELLDALEAAGLAEDTVVVFMSDHGDMLGDHGLWSKRQFFEWSARIPLIVHNPARFAAHTVDSVTSLADMFSTFVDLAGLPCSTEVDGDSLAPLLRGDADNWRDSAVCEYMGEGVLHPMRMLRRGQYKYVHAHEEAPMLFDLESDPRECTNVAGQPAYADIEAELRQACLNDWDGAALDAAVRTSQQERFLMRDATTTGCPHPWDWQPRFDGTAQYYREFEDQRGDD
jgi:choline-sulfatase